MCMFHISTLEDDFDRWRVKQLKSAALDSEKSHCLTNQLAQTIRPFVDKILHAKCL